MREKGMETCKNIAKSIKLSKSKVTLDLSRMIIPSLLKIES